MIGFFGMAGVLLMSVAVAGCESQSAAPGAEQPTTTSEENTPLPVGASCTIQFRRDALGGNMTNPIPPTTGAINGASVSISGKLKAINDDWVIITGNGQETWVPRNMVLLIQLNQ